MIEDPRVVAATIRTVIGLAGILLVWQYICLPSLRDGLRAKLFEIRRDLFLYAAEGGVSFSNPSYVAMRDTLNWYIRNAEKLNFGRIWLLMTLVGETAIQAPDLDQMISEVRPGEARSRLRAFRQREVVAIALHMLQTSPVAWLHLFSVLIHGGRKHIAQTLTQKLPSSEPTWDICRT